MPKCQINLSDYHFVSIGGGQGFEYNTISQLVKPSKSFTIIEPDSAMYHELEMTQAGRDINVSLYNCLFQEIKDQLQGTRPKIIIVNSVLHHIINFSSFMKDLDEVIRKDDILLLSHEPNNSCSLFTIG